MLPQQRRTRVDRSRTTEWGVAAVGACMDSAKRGSARVLLASSDCGSAESQPARHSALRPRCCSPKDLVKKEVHALQPWPAHQRTAHPDRPHENRSIFNTASESCAASSTSRQMRATARAQPWCRTLARTAPSKPSRGRRRSSQHAATPTFSRGMRGAKRRWRIACLSDGPLMPTRSSNGSVSSRGAHPACVSHH